MLSAPSLVPPHVYCLQALERVIPDIRRRTELKLVGTPLTHERELHCLPLESEGAAGESEGVRAGLVLESSGSPTASHAPRPPPRFPQAAPRKLRPCDQRQRWSRLAWA